jgi:TetR/AcrR family transcriptional regulator, lmrAB and yxaGH operons repressor
MIGPFGLDVFWQAGYILRMTPDLPTRERLIVTAATLFRQNGYHATGLAELLLAARVPKGSLYHHFPDGKADLAMAAADWVAAEYVRIMDDAFGPAPDFVQGATTLCFKLAKLFDKMEATNACPLTAMLFDGPEGEGFRAHAEAGFQRLAGHLAAHGVRLGLAVDVALDKAELLIMAIQGTWTIARTQRHAEALRKLPGRLFTA